MRHLDKDAHPITGVFLTATGAAMQEVLQYGKCIGDDPVRLAAFHVNDKTYAAGIMFLGRLIKTRFTLV